MSVGVFTRRKRVTFVEKTTGEVGDGTAWPIQVTLDQLAEIMYRVKDAWFSAGELSITYTGTVPLISGSTRIDTAAPPSEFVSMPIFGCFIKRSYYNPSPIPDGSGPGIPDYTGYFGAPYTVDSVDYYDVAGNERAMGLRPYYSSPASPRFNAIGESFVTGFSHDLSFPFGFYPGIWGSGYAIIGEDTLGSYSGTLTVIFSGEVAWVNDDASGNPISPGNRLFVGVKFYASSDVLVTHPFQIASYQGDLGGSPMDATIAFKLELHSGTVSCPLYYYTGVGAADTISGYDFTMTPHAWWPYAKAGGPVWNSTTGAKL